MRVSKFEKLGRSSLSLSLLVTLTPNLLQQDHLAQGKRSSQTHTGCRQIITPTNPQNKRHPKCKLYKKKKQFLTSPLPPHHKTFEEPAPHSSS
jgi:hypothetical protein